MFGIYPRRSPGRAWFQVLPVDGSWEASFRPLPASRLHRLSLETLWGRIAPMHSPIRTVLQHPAAKPSPIPEAFNMLNFNVSRSRAWSPLMVSIIFGWELRAETL